MNKQIPLTNAHQLVGQLVVLLILVGAVWLRSVATRTPDCSDFLCNQPAVTEVVSID